MTGILGQDHVGVAFDVHHLGGGRGVVVELEGVVGQTRQGRRTLQTDLDETLHGETIALRTAEQQVLGLDPAHRARELPGEELDQENAGQLGGLGGPVVPVGEDLVQRIGRHERRDLLDEIASEVEQARHQVRNVAADQDVDVDVGGQQLLELAAELRHTGAQDAGVERDVDTRDEDERPLATELGTATVDLGLEVLQAPDRAGDRVLRAEQVEVDDLEELTDLRTQAGDEAGHIGVGETELARPDRGHAIVAAALLISRNEMVHGLAALEHDLEDRLERQDAGAGGESVVLADGVTTGDGALDEAAGLLEFGDLRDTEGRHRDLGELRQVQHAVGMVVGGAVGDQGRRVVPHDGQDREAERLARVLVGAIPDLTGCLGPRPGVEAHALALDALPREGVDGARRGQEAGGAHDEVVADLGADLDDLTAVVEADTVDAHGDGVAEADHPQIACSPADQRSRRRGRVLRVGRGDDLLRGSRQPHAVHDRVAESGQLGCRGVGVDRIAVTGDDGEAVHAVRRGDGGRTEQLAGGRLLGLRGTARAERVGELGGTEASADGEALVEGGDRAGSPGDLHRDLDDTAHVGVADRAGTGGHRQFGGLRGDLTGESDRMVEVDQVEQTLDDRCAGLGAGGTYHAEHAGPAGADQGVGDGEAEGLGRGGRTQVRGQGEAGHRCMVGHRVGLPGDGGGRGAVGHLGEFAARGDREDLGHRAGCLVESDDRRSAVAHAETGEQRDAHGRTGDRDDEIETDDAVLGTGLLDDGAGGLVLGTLGGDDRPGGAITEEGDRARDDPSRPADVVGFQNSSQDAGVLDQSGTVSRGNLHRTHTCGQQVGDDLRLEAVQQLADRLVDAGDAGNGDRTGDDAHGVGAVARVVGLPQRVTAPPAAHVLVDDRHEVDRLARGAALLQEERDVRGMQDVGVDLAVDAAQRVDRGVRVVGGRQLGEHRRDGTRVLRVHAGLGALQHLDEALLPGDVGPRVLIAVGVADREGGVAVEPFAVGHLGDVAEVRLGGVRHRRDDLVAACGDGLGVTGDLVQQTAAAGRGVVDLVDVGAELRTARSHSGGRVACTDPLVDTDGVDEELLDLGSGGGLLGGHRRGADEDAVERHQRIAVAARPDAGQVFAGTLRGTDAAADADDHVGSGAEFAVGGEQQVVEVLPRVVATGAAALDLDDDRMVRDLVGDPHNRTDLLHGARLEGDEAESGLDELVDEGDRVLEFGDAGGDDHAVERRALGTGLLHEAFATELQLPQVRVEEQRVELRLATRLEQVGESGDVAGEDVLGDLASTGELGPVAGVGRGGDDRRVDGGRGHAREQHRRTSGETRERGLDDGPAVGQLDEGRGELGPRGGDLGHPARAEEVALSDAQGGGDEADTLAADER